MGVENDPAGNRSLRILRAGIHGWIESASRTRGIAAAVADAADLHGGVFGDEEETEIAGHRERAELA